MGIPVPQNLMSFGKKLVSCYQTAVHEHRHNAVSYFPFANIVRELIEKVKKEDGGGDHNINHISTQILIICLFLQLNLDMLIALRCCMSLSWVNLAEQVMSLLNLELQNCALERDPVKTTEFQNMLKKVTPMNQLRTVSK